MPAPRDFLRRVMVATIVGGASLFGFGQALVWLVGAVGPTATLILGSFLLGALLSTLALLQYQRRHPGDSPGT